MKFITDKWGAGGGSDEDGPADDGRFKIYIERRPGRSEIELRYDFGAGIDRETNSIYWRVLEV